jgi:hypothetical protein
VHSDPTAAYFEDILLEPRPGVERIAPIRAEERNFAFKNVHISQGNSSRYNKL